MMYDPVCGMEVDPAEAPASGKFEGETYYFCSEDCYQEFMEDPGDFAGETARPGLE